MKQANRLMCKDAAEDNNYDAYKCDLENDNL